MRSSPVTATIRTRFAALGLVAVVLAGSKGLAADLAKQDRDMLARLEAIRLLKAQVKGGRFDVAGADKAYAAAFRAYGIDVEQLEPAQAAERIRKQAIRTELAIALDDWAMARRASGKDGAASWKRLLSVARRADPDPWRDRLRGALAETDKKTLQQMATQASKQSPITIALLGDALAASGAIADAVALLRRGQRKHPADFWINHQLGVYLGLLKPPRVEEAVGFYRAALALQPSNPGVYHNLGTALHQLGRLHEAAAAYREAIRLKPDFAEAHLNLGATLAAQGKLAEAISACRHVIRLQPSNARAYLTLGNLLFHQGKLDEAMAAYRRALQLDPRSVKAHLQLGNALSATGRLEEAIACYRAAIALDPRNAAAYNNLGLALFRKGRLEEAIVCYRKALALDPREVRAHIGLGNVLRAKGQLDEAVACYRKAIELQPKNADAFAHLGDVLARQGKLAEAKAARDRAAALREGAKKPK
jgi:tetratricopeptide (TPR) repeat protein